jgi:AcrR family transcriptional regulator
VAQSKRRYHHGNLHRALLDAALRLIRKEGADALTLRGAARAAGVSPAAPYRHFADKDALLAAVAEEGFRMMAAKMRAAAEAHPDDGIGRFRACGMAYIAFARAHPEHFRVMFGPYVANRAKYPGLKDAAGESFALLEERIVDGQKAGIIVKGDVRSLALATWSMTHGFASLLVNRQLEERGAGADPEDLASRVTATLFLGIGKKPRRSDGTTA